MTNLRHTKAENMTDLRPTTFHAHDARTVINLDIHRDAERLRLLLEWAAREMSALSELLPAAVDAAELPSPRATSREDSRNRATGLRHDPTHETAADSRRRTVAESVVASEHALKSTLAALVAARRAVKKSVREWEGS